MSDTNIYQSMAAIMRAVEPIRKEKTNKQGEGFKYRGIDDVMNSLHQAFADAGVFVTTEVLERTERERLSRNGGTLFYVTSRIKFTFHAQDGSSISSIVNGTAMDSGDKADNKSLSIGLKYALLQAFLIPTEDMAEPDGQTHEVAPAKQAARPAPAPTKQTAPVPITAEKFKAFTDYIIKTPSGAELDKVVNYAAKEYIYNEDQINYINELLTQKTTEQ